MWDQVAVSWPFTHKYLKDLSTKKKDIFKYNTILNFRKFNIC